VENICEKLGAVCCVSVVLAVVLESGRLKQEIHLSLVLGSQPGMEEEERDTHTPYLSKKVSLRN
jgi:hypothetical protein